MATRDFLVEVSDEAIHQNLQRLAAAQTEAPPVKRSRFVQLIQHGEREHMRTTTLDQFKACIGDSWKALGDITIDIVRLMSRRGTFFTQLDNHLFQLKILAAASPVIKGSPSFTVSYLPIMDSANYVFPIRPTWVELIDLPSFCTQSMLNQLLSALGAVVKIPYLSQRLAFASIRALIIWDFRLPLVEELQYQYDGLTFRQKVRFLELGEPCPTCGFSVVLGCKCSHPQESDPLPKCPPGHGKVAEAEFCMRVSSWNLGGLASPPRKFWIRSFIRKTRPKVLAIQELHISKAQARFINPLAPDYICLMPDELATTVGTLLFVHKSCEVLEWEFDSQCHFGWVILRVQGFEFGVVSVYAPNSADLRTSFWRRLRQQLPIRPWVICGDWNMTEVFQDSSAQSSLLRGSEKEVFARVKTDFRLTYAREVAEELWGPVYTRFQQTVNGFKWAVLDRFYFSDAANWLFTVAALAHHADFVFSDHLPISVALQFDPSDVIGSKRGAPYFKVDQTILKDQSLLDQLKAGWSDLGPPEDLSLTQYMLGWSKQLQIIREAQRTRDRNLAELPALEKQLQVLHEQNDFTLAAEQQLHAMTQRVRSLRALQDHKLRVWSQAKFLRWGEEPTAYYLRRFKKRLARNILRCLQLENGDVLTNPLDMAGFIRGRSTQDNVFLLQLLHDELKAHKRSAAFVKLDFSKAYDRLSHEYLWLALEKVGCGNQFIRLVKSLTVGATSAIYSDGLISRSFPLLSGVRQGCPLAPLIFAIATIPLVNSFVQACSSGSLAPAYTALGVPVIISLFADDSAVYLPWSQHAFQVMQSLLDTFCNATGSKINYEKSQIVPTGDISHLPEWIYQVGYQVVPPRQPIKYLGFWFGADVAPDQVWEAAVRSLNRRVTSWDDKLITFEGRVILLRHILGAIPIHTLSVSWATGKQYLQIRRQLAGFLWGSRTHLTRWTLVEQPLESGGLGIRDLRRVQQAFYGKAILRLLLQEQLTDWMRVLVEMCRHRDRDSLAEAILFRRIPPSFTISCRITVQLSIDTIVKFGGKFRFKMVIGRLGGSSLRSLGGRHEIVAGCGGYYIRPFTLEHIRNTRITLCYSVLSVVLPQKLLFISFAVVAGGQCRIVASSSKLICTYSLLLSS
ncbi:hypothetical protein R1sor_027553 [Riccia sorocarpa]|uniref:Reverse transcriptase domain-containing protein n=1 Tax=Riccia sorocarpa TaxID=122646 RepID=A0ABD3GHU7_9MARC